MELDAVETLLWVLEGGHRRPRTRCERRESLRRLEDAVAMAHPALLLRRQSREQAPAVVGHGEGGSTEFTRLRPLDAVPEHQHHRLHPVTDAEHRNAELEQLAAQVRGALGI